MPRWQVMKFRSFDVPLQDLGRAQGHVAVAGAVEAVAADLVARCTGGRGWGRCRPGRAWSGGRPCRRRPPAARPAAPSCAASMPVMLAGLCSGARGMHSRRASITSAVISTEPEYFSPACTTRWPTALISSSGRHHAVLGVGQRRQHQREGAPRGRGSAAPAGSPAGRGRCRRGCPAPGRCARPGPWPAGARRSMSRSWYFSELLPQLMTRTLRIGRLPLS